MDTTPYFPPPAAPGYGPADLPRYGPPALPPPDLAALPPAPPAARSAPSPAAGWLKVVAVVVTTLLSLPVAAFTGFAALVVYTGCFIGCQPEDADPLGGLGLAAVAGAICAAGPLLAAALYRSRAWLIAGIWVTGVASVLAFAVLSHG